MEYRKLGRTGLKVSVLCLGTMVFGNQVKEEEATRIIETALEGGMNFFDTADVYVNGRSEEIVRKALQKARQSVVIATKVAGRMGEGPNDAGLSRKHIMQAAEDSLKRLGTDYIDLYYVHHPDYDTPVEETLRALDDLVREGKVRYIGCSNFRAWQLCKALWVSDSLDLARFDCIQPPYNLLARDVEYELLSLCAAEGVGVCVYNPLAGGMLTGKYTQGAPPPANTRFGQERTGQMYFERYGTAADFAAVERLKKLAAAHGCSLAQFSLAWVMSNPAVTAPICGATSVKQMQENLGAASITLAKEDLAACDELWQQLRPPRHFYGR